MPSVATGDLNGSTLYGRVSRLIISIPKGSFSDTDPTLNAIEISGGDDPKNPGLRIVFKIKKTSQKEPNTFEIVIYNLAPENRVKLQQKGVRLLLEAGYAGIGLQRICLGDVRTADHIRDHADWKTTLTGGDGERSFQFARSSESFAAGSTVGQVVQFIVSSMGLALGNSAAQASKLSKVLQQGWTSHGAASSELDRILRSVGYSYSIQDGELQILAPGESVAQSIPLLSPSTGLLGSPEMGSPEKKGKPQLLKYRSLLQPEARPGGRNRVQGERYDGIFRDRTIEHSGDTHGGEWFTEHNGVADSSAKVA